MSTDEPQLPDLSSLLGGDGDLPDLGSMMDGLSKMQEARDQVYEGTAGGGLVRIRANGGFEVESVVIDPKALDGADAEEVADLVHAALNDLTATIADAQREAMGPLGGLGGLLG
jgi:DNA-binding YbaB/EbfC family protein